MFIALLVSSTIIQYVEAPTLAANARNSRSLYRSNSAERGPILVAGVPVAMSTKSNSSIFTFQRSYPEGQLYAAVTGYYPVNGEPTGIEHAENSYLSGQSSSQFFDQISRLFSGQAPIGASIETTIDPTVQKAAWDALADYQGSVVVTEINTGRILALVSKPDRKSVV